MFKNYLRVVGVAVLLTVGLGGCAWSPNPKSVEQAQQESLQARTPVLYTPAIKEEGVLTIGLTTKSSGAPFIINQDDGSVHGYEVDFISAVADDLGLSLRFVEVNGTSDLEQVDGVMGIAPGDVSGAVVVAGYAESATAFFWKGDETILDASMLQDKRLGLQAGSVSEAALAKTNLTMQPTEFSNLNEAFAALDEGSIDFVICDAYAGAYLASAYEGIACAGCVDTPKGQGIAVAADNPELQRALQTSAETLASNGLLDIIRSRWLGSFTPLTSQSVVTGVGPAAPAEPVPAEQGDENGNEQTGDEAANQTDEELGEAGANAVTIVG